MPKPRRCVCGKSKTFPICDFSHQSEKWQCTPDTGAATKFCFIAGPQNLNLAEKLAHQFGGIAVHLSDEKVQSELTVVLTEGTDLDTIERLGKKTASDKKVVFAINTNADVVASVFQTAKVFEVEGESLDVWQKIKSACQELVDAEGESPQVTRPPRSLFVSHSVVDEPFIVPAVEYARKYFGADVFLCADSIATGSDWQAEILTRLRETEEFVFVLSQDSATSAFCAFEVGYATAIGKNLAIISIDGSLPPAFAQKIQMADVERLRLRSPWLDAEEAFLELLLDLL